MEARLEAITLSRSATVFCEVDIDAGTGGAGAGAGAGGDGGLSEGLLGWILLVGAVALGTSAGNAVKDRLRKRKRKGLL